MAGVAAMEQGRTDESLDYLDRAVSLQPLVALFHSNRGEVLRRVGRIEAAIDALRTAISLDPNFADAHLNLGVALQAQGCEADACKLFQIAVHLQPDNANACYHLANALLNAGDLVPAEVLYRRTLALAPAWSGALTNLGALQLRQGRLAEAEKSFRRVLELDLDNKEALLNLAELHERQGRYVDAAAAYEAVLRQEPENADAHFGLGGIAKGRDDPDAAVEHYRKAIAIRPRFANAHANLGLAMRDRGEQDEAIEALCKGLEIDRSLSKIHSMLLLTLYLRFGTTPAQLEREKISWDRIHAAPLAANAPHANDRTPERRLRIGYVSGDFREHPVARFTMPLLEEHDRRSYEVVCFSSVRRQDSQTATIMEVADEWHDIAHADDVMLAELVRSAKIDVLVDLGMHTINNHLLAFARRPAPVQISYLAYCDGPGLSAMDYRITDKFIDAPGQVGYVGHETPLALNGCYWCYPTPAAAPDVSPLPAERNGHVTYGSLSMFAKVTSPTLDAWAEVLKRKPGSRLILYAPPGSSRERIQSHFHRHGVDGGRIDFTSRVDLVEYFRLYGSVDVSLDTFPCAGGTTTCDALWMGTPVVSLAGDLPTSRAGLSILSHMGLHGYIARTTNEYVACALAAAADLPQLALLRSGMRERMQSSGVMDVRAFVQDMENAYRAAWRAWCASGVT